MPLKPIDIGWTARQLDTIGDIATAAGNGSSGFYGDGGPASSALLSSPQDISIDVSGNIYIAEYSNHVIRMVTKSTGIISTVAGTPRESGSSGDGGLAMSAKLNSPTGVAVDVSGNIYIADTSNNLLRMVTKNTGIISRVAGTPKKYGFSGDGGPALSAKLYYPSGIALDVSGNIYIADYFNSVIRMITVSTGIISKVAGTSNQDGYSGDGGSALSAQLFFPKGVAVDVSGNIYIADYFNHVIRMVTKSTGIISTVAGTTPKSPGYSGDGGPATSAKLLIPSGVAVDVSGNIYIADTGNRIIRMVTKNTGIISTVAGTPNKYGSSGDGGPALSALLNNPRKVVATNGGTFYIADSDGNTIRTFTIKPVSATSSAIPGGRHLAFYILYSSVWWTLVSVIFVIW